MAGSGIKLFQDEQILDAAQVNGYLMDQTILRFATTTARDAAFGGIGEPTLAEGMTCYIDADNTLYTFNGTNWVKMVSATTPVGLEYIGSWSATSGTSLRLTDCFSATYRNYQLNINGYSNATTYARLSITFGGSTAGYKLGGQYWPTLSSTGVSRYGSGITTVSSGELGFITDSNTRCAGTVMIYEPFQSSFTHYVSQSSHSASDNAVGPSWVSGWHSIAGSHTFCDIAVTSGAFQNIECRMYGYRD